MAVSANGSTAGTSIRTDVAQRGSLSREAHPAEHADYTFPEVDETSFPYVPTVPAGEEDAKNPAWLNDPLLYHNRGNTSFTGENSLYGDFFGLDDLWTERREVVDGMVDIYSSWIEEFGVDGFRIDTTKHVNLGFWQVFGPEIVEAARDAGRPDFFAFGEVFDQQFGSPFMSHFSTKGKLQSTIDFGFQLRGPDEYRFQQLLGPPRLDGRGHRDGLDGPAPPCRLGPVRDRVPDPAGRRCGSARLHPAPRRHQGSRPRPVPGVRHLRPRGLATPGSRPREPVRRSFAELKGRTDRSR